MRETRALLSSALAHGSAGDGSWTPIIIAHFMTQLASLDKVTPCTPLPFPAHPNYGF